MEDTGDVQSVDDAMQYLQTVENELEDKDFAEFLGIIEDFKSNKYRVPAPLPFRPRLSPASACSGWTRPNLHGPSTLPSPAALSQTCALMLAGAFSRATTCAHDHTSRPPPRVAW
jgi:hypothetical protein